MATQERTIAGTMRDTLQLL